MSHLRLVHSQPVEECETRPVYRHVTLALVLAILLTLAIDGLAIWFAVHLYNGGTNVEEAQ